MRFTESTFSFRTFVLLCLLSIGAMMAILYVLFQGRFMIIGPQITLAVEPTRVSNERVIYLEGTAFNISRLWLNDRQIFTNASGDFREALVLENGYTRSTLRAEDRYGRATTLERSFVYTPASVIQ